MFAFSGDIHRVATFTHVSSLTVVAGIFSCPLHGSQRFLCLLSISFKVATNLGTNMYAQLSILFIHIHIWLFESLAGSDSLWYLDPRHFLTLALNLNFLLLPLFSLGACGDASICQIILVLRKPPLLLFWYAARWRTSPYQGRNLWAL